MNKIQVDDLHRLHYAVHGNPNGETILFLHGGPGLGTTVMDLQYFDLKKVQVILFDQRGCGQSLPKGELKNNTTSELIEDIHLLLQHLKIEQTYLFGGSWGSTLSLLFGIKYPEKIKGMILRGLFTATKEERIHFESGGTSLNYPQEWQRFMGHVPETFREEPSVYYFNQILNGSPELKEKYAYELNYYGLSISSHQKIPGDKEMIIRRSDFLTKAKILAHYSKNSFFISDEFIKQNMHHLTKIPIKVIHGINDEITLASHAEEFCKDHQNIELILVEGGHSPSDKHIKIALQEALNKMMNMKKFKN